MTRAERNKAFKKETAAQKRVSIARDALEWIKKGALIPRTGNYVVPIDNRIASDLAWSESAQLRDLNLGPCNVCGVGALFIAKAVRYNDAKPRDAQYPHTNLLEYFSAKQLLLIENYFEGRDASPLGDSASSDDNRIERFAYHFKTSVRLVHILENIIKNNGTFKPQELDQLLP